MPHRREKRGANPLVVRLAGLGFVRKVSCVAGSHGRAPSRCCVVSRSPPTAGCHLKPVRFAEVFEFTERRRGCGPRRRKDGFRDAVAQAPAQEQCR